MHVYSRGGVGAAGAVNWSLFDMSGLEVCYPVRFFFFLKCLLPGWILIFFFQKIPDFENSSWIFFHLKKFLKFFAEIP